MSKASLSLLFLLSTLTLPAQESVLLAQNGPTDLKARPAPVVVSISFPGGTLGEFVAKIRGAEPKANIIVALAANEARLPPIELRSAGLEQALEGACAVAEAEFQVRVHDFKGGSEPVFSILAIPNQGPVGTAMSQGRVKAAEFTQVYSLNRLTDGEAAVPGTQFQVETILSAIEAGTKDDAKPVVMRFHRESGLLVVRATPEQMALVSEVLNILERDLKDRRPRTQADRARPAKPKSDETPIEAKKN